MNGLSLVSNPAAELAKNAPGGGREISLKELPDRGLESVGNSQDYLLSRLSDIKSLSPEQLREQMEKNLGQSGCELTNRAVEGVGQTEGLTDEQKQRIKEETGWSDEVINYIGSWEEYEIYKEAGLEEFEIDGKKRLIRSDIEWDQTDENDMTNAERVQKGLAPLDKDGNPIELHHIGQHRDSPLAELTFQEHRGKGNDAILHNKKIESETHGADSSWDQERKDYWKSWADSEHNTGGNN